ncbi:MAG TPA: group III truncated hemoglobin [Devosiaceae bacterium]|jgi:hemoglobin|nr:group III truncated hemoglobin [Devosiaceae bacterium]
MTASDRPPIGTRLRASGPVVPEGLDDTLIREVVTSFYASARLDPVIGPVFNRVIAEADWPHHLDKIEAFWSSMLLASGRYQGRPMPKHIAIGDLADRHFERWLALFRQTVEALCPPEIAAVFVERAERVGNSFRLSVLSQRGEDIIHLKPLRAGTLPATEEQ